MSATTASAGLGRAVGFCEAPIGKKVVMAVSGVILFGFVAGHMTGNLLIFLGPERINDYARFLRASPALLWGARLVLLAAVAAHVTASVQLALLKRAARPIGYARYAPVQADYASRTMMWSGPILLAFVVYHLLHFTFGTAHPSFRELDVYANVVAGFRVVPVSLVYIVAMLLLGLHLYHGAWSMFQSMGVGHPRWTPALKRFAAAAAAILAAGNISIPIAVLSGLVE